MKLGVEEAEAELEMERRPVKEGRSATTVLEFLVQIYHLRSFKLFVLYYIVILCSRVWKRFTKPMELRKAMVVYNFAISLVNLYTCARFTYHALTSKQFFSRDFNDDIIYTFYLYWITKIVELLDTIFMILRHRGRQISFLHVFHHSTMLVLSEYGYRHTPFVSMAIFLGINAFVHIVLYFYYGLSALNPESPPQWKKRLTQMQIAQFLVDLVLAVYGYLHHTFCIYSIFYGLSMLFLFSKFYYQAYVKPRPKKA